MGKSKSRMSIVQERVTLVKNFDSYQFLEKQNELLGPKLKTSAFPINVLQIQFNFGSAKTFWTGLKKKSMHTEFHLLNMSKNF